MVGFLKVLFLVFFTLNMNKLYNNYTFLTSGYPDVVARMIKEGHVVGDHSWVCFK